MAEACQSLNPCKIYSGTESWIVYIIISLGSVHPERCLSDKYTFNIHIMFPKLAHLCVASKHFTS